MLKRFRELTAPGYFNFSETNAVMTQRVEAWFDAYRARLQNQIDLFDSIFRLWMTRDYSLTTMYRTPYIAKLLRDWGLSWFTGTDEQAAALIAYITRGYEETVAEQILYFGQVMKAAPFNWFYDDLQIVYGTQRPAIMQDIFLIYGTSGATPAPTPYAPRTWNAPSGWTKTANNTMTHKTAGYLSGGNIVWLTPVAYAATYANHDVPDLSSLPGSASAGDTAIVEDDTTGDVNAVYFFDGSLWRKISAPRADEGLISGGIIPTPEPRGVFDDSSPSRRSEDQPPVSGPSGGFGMYFGWGQNTLRSRLIECRVTLTVAGRANLGVIVFLMRKLKPILNRLTLIYTVFGLPDPPTTVEIIDMGHV